MKITTYLAQFAAGALIATALGVTIGHGALVLFSVSAAAIVLMVAIGDYAPHRHRTADYAAALIARRRRESMPLAA